MINGYNSGSDDDQLSSEYLEGPRAGSKPSAAASNSSGESFFEGAKRRFVDFAKRHHLDLLKDAAISPQNIGSCAANIFRFTSEMYILSDLQGGQAGRNEPKNVWIFGPERPGERESIAEGRDGYQPKLCDIFIRRGPDLIRFLFFTMLTTTFFLRSLDIACNDYTDIDPISFNIEALCFCVPSIYLLVRLACQKMDDVKREYNSQVGLHCESKPALDDEVVYHRGNLVAPRERARRDLIAEVALFVFKLLVLSSFFVISGLSWANIITPKELGGYFCLAGATYFFGTYFFRLGLDFSRLKRERLEAQDSNKIKERILASPP